MLVVFITILLMFSVVYICTKENKEKAEVKPEVNASPLSDNYTKSNLPEIYDKPDTYKIRVAGVITKKVWFTTINVNIDALGQADNRNHRMHVDMNISIPISGMENSGLYLIENTLYTKKSGSWVKKELNEEEKEYMWDKYNFIKRETELIKSSDFELIGNENVMGSDSLIVKVTPDKEALKDYVTSWLEQLSAAGLEKYIDSVDTSEMEFKNATFRYWIAEDTYLIKKEHVEADVVIAKESYNMQISAEMYDYNKPVNIVLPEDV